MTSSKTIEAYFTGDDLERVRRAVDDAEGLTAGEIVPYVVAASDSYEGALWKASAFGALAGSLAAGAAHWGFGLWGGPVHLWITMPTFLGAAIGYVAAALVPALRRSLIPDDVLDQRVRRRAMVAFLDEEVFRTNERTGILLFVSLMERRVVVLGDEGINRRVEEGEWSDVVERIVRGIRRREAADALIEAIAMCGRLLERRGVAIREDDVDELSDEVRTSDR